MKIKIISVGKIKEKYLEGGINEYIKRLTPYIKLKLIEVPDEKAPENLTVNELRQVLTIEGSKIMSKIAQNDYVISLAIKGKEKNSEQLADFFNKHMIYNGRDIVFVIGGSNGLSKEVIDRSNELLSFSNFTFPHQLMRLILLEQIYRSFKIIKNEPYHK